MEDDVLAALDVRFKPESEPQQQTSDADVPVRAPPGANAAETAANRGTAALMLRRLQQLPWRRIDVCFKGSPLSILSHNHIQVREAWEFNGVDSVGRRYVWCARAC